MIKLIQLSAVLAAMLASVACSPNAPSGSSSSDTQSFSGELSKSEYNALTDEQKYQVANKLMGTMFKGIPVDDFFDISNGMSNLSLKSGDNFLNNTKKSLEYQLTQAERTQNDLLITDIDDDRQTDNDENG